MNNKSSGCFKLTFPPMHDDFLRQEIIDAMQKAGKGKEGTAARIRIAESTISLLKGKCDGLRKLRKDVDDQLEQLDAYQHGADMAEIYLDDAANFYEYDLRAMEKLLSDLENVQKERAAGSCSKRQKIGV